MPKIDNQCVEFAENGDPKQVLRLTTNQVDTDKVGRNDALLRWLATPVNPLDINIIQGQYAFKVELPAIGGSEGVAIVEKVGTNVWNIAKGDHVIVIGTFARSTWTQFSIVDANNLIKVNKKIDLVSAATLTVNPPTAYLLLTQFVKLDYGDFIIQNAANSGVGRSVIQIAKEYRLKTINIIRGRPSVEKLKTELVQLGADYVFTEEEFQSLSKQFLRDLNVNIKLALNGVGGRSALQISSVLDYGGTMVTYGGMSKKPSEILTSSLLFKDIKVIGFMVGRFMMEPENAMIVREMFHQLTSMIIVGVLKPVPVDFHFISNFQMAIRNTMEPSTTETKKQILLLQSKSYYDKSKM